MAKKLIVKINMFSINQSIYTIDENSKIKIISDIPLNKLSEYVYDITSSEDIEEIELDGPEAYIQKYGFDILENLSQNYSDRKVKVKLNGEVFN